MNLEANHAPKQRAVEPLIFRSMVEQCAMPPKDPLAHTAEDAMSPSDILDFATELSAAREGGRLEGLAAAEQECARKLQVERDLLQTMVVEFQQEKQRYFTTVEGEVVKLALAIAERVMRREAEMDPLLLAGVARVAINQIADAGEAKLHVAASDLDRWTETLKPAPKGLVVEGDETLKRGDVVLKTSSGTVDLGLRVQLQEIERGFFEVLGRKPSMVV